MLNTLLDVRTERRFLTVLFCDMVDSTAHQYRMDPERFGALLAAYRQIVFDQVRRHRGHVARVIGDGVLAFFGWPRAVGKDAQMAVICALEIGRELARRHDFDGDGAGMAVRMGIETGWVLVGDIGPTGQIEQSGVIGPAPNVAARLQHLARHNGLVVGEGTLTLLPDWFLTDPADTSGVNLPEPVKAAHVIGISDNGDPLGRLQPSRLAPLIGREAELGRLAEAWDRAASAAGQVMLLSGEAGMGKSRLVGALLDHVPAGGHEAIALYCAEQTIDNSFHPLIEPLTRELRLKPDASNAEILSAATSFARRIGHDADVEGIALATLLGMPIPPGIPNTELRRRTFNVLSGWIAERAARNPLIFIVEDFQWADSSLATFVAQLADRAAAMRLLLLITHRADHGVEWPDKPHFGRLALGPLSSADAARLAAAVLDTSDPAAAAMIAERAECVPLFVEEFARASLDQGRRTDRLPGSISQLLTARLDALGPARRLAQLVAVVGQEAPLPLLASVSGLSEVELAQQAGLLLDSGIMIQRFLGETTLLSFRHALLRAAAYQALPAVHRCRLHDRVAAQLRASNPALETAAPAILGWHLEQADRPAEATVLFRRAAAIGLAGGAYVEAEAHARRAVRLAEADPDRPPDGPVTESLYAALGLLGESLIATRGEGSSDVRATYERATRLALRARATRNLPPLLRGLCASYQVRGPLARARELGERLLQLSEHLGDQALIADAERRLGWCLLCQGNLHEAGLLLERSTTRALGADAASPTSSALDTRVLGLANLAILGSLRDSDERTRERTDTAVAAAEACRKPLAAAYGYGCAALTRMMLGDNSATRRLARKTERAAAEHGLVYWAALAHILRGWADARSGNATSGLADLREGLSLYGKTESLVLRPLALMMLADAQAEAGSVAGALEALDEAEAVAGDIGAVVFKCVLLAARGRILLTAGDPTAQDAFARARTEALAGGATTVARKAALGLETGPRGNIDLHLVH